MDQILHCKFCLPGAALSWRTRREKADGYCLSVAARTA
jgi:hypothetical protein